MSAPLFSSWYLISLTLKVSICSRHNFSAYPILTSQKGHTVHHEKQIKKTLLAKSKQLVEPEINKQKIFFLILFFDFALLFSYLKLENFLPLSWFTQNIIINRIKYNTLQRGCKNNVHDIKELLALVDILRITF